MQTSAKQLLPGISTATGPAELASVTFSIHPPVLLIVSNSIDNNFPSPWGAKPPEISIPTKFPLNSDTVK